ncbi:hypothetical protein ACFYO2_43105 [Streptomyces sp. NPDC006602]|uniref:hypothetical protein n=1 Tax=Streptomyces sp. NPDC006602 TaxID=3364751 RepID=UPI00368B7C2A
MNQRNYGMYLLAAAIVAGALMVGASPGIPIWFALVAACPLMMLFMMKSIHGQDMHRGHGRDDDPLHKHDHYHHPGSGRR